MAKNKKATKKTKKTAVKRDYGRFINSQTLGFFLLALAGITFLTLVFPGGTLGSQWNSFLRLLFGWGAYLTPLVFLAYGLGFVWQRLNEDYKLRWQEASGWLTLFFSCLLLLQVLGLDSKTAEGQELGGGIVGFYLHQSLLGAMGSAGALAALAVVAVGGVCLSFNLSPRHIASSVSRGVKAAITWYRDLLFPVRPVEAEREPTVRKLRSPILSLPKLSLPKKPEKQDKQEKQGTPAPLVKLTVKKEEQPPLPDPGPVVRGEWELPPLSMLESSAKGEMSPTDIRQKVQLIEDTLADFNVQARVIEVNQGPSITQFGVEPGFHETRAKTGAVVRREKVKVSEITSLANDIALALAAPTIRIEAPVPGRAVVGIEVPNSSTSVVSLRGVIESEKFQKVKVKSKLGIALGENVSGQATVGDLAKMPHLLIAGATGSGKSVCLNAIIAGFLLQATPDELRMILVDPKRVEMIQFNDVPHLLRPVVVDVDKAVGVLKWVAYEMDQRYKRFEKERVRNIEDFNKAMAKNGEPQLHYIVVVIDELADLMMTAAEEVERTICRLAQLARATGIHLVIATQRPSVDVITGLIKANFPTRISFTMTSQVDSRTILDMAGAEKLLGRGDMLYMPSDAAKPIRLQGVWVSDTEIEAIVSFWRAQGPAKYVDTLMNVQGWAEAADGEKDDLFEKAVDLARQHNHVSTSLLQRRLRIGYSRAARIIDKMEEEGIVGPSEGGKSREVLLKEDAENTGEAVSAAVES